MVKGKVRLIPHTSQVVGWISAAVSCLVYPPQEEKWLIRPRFLWHEATRSISTPPLDGMLVHH